MTCAASDNRAGTEELRLRMPHDNYSTAADKVFHDGTLFPQPRNHISSAKALWPRAAGKLPARVRRRVANDRTQTLPTVRRDARACSKPDIRPDTCGGARQCLSYPTIQWRDPMIGWCRTFCGCIRFCAVNGRL